MYKQCNMTLVNNFVADKIQSELSMHLYIYIYTHTQAGNHYYTDKTIEIYYLLWTNWKYMDFSASVYISMPCNAVNFRIG